MRKILILVAANLFFLAVIVGTAEIILESYFGLGSPPLYVANPLFGYRLRADQNLTRFAGSEIKINNLGLRADEDWDSAPDNKVLFLGDSVTYGGSYLSNKQLFSALAVSNLPLKAGNAGVNGWGVENIHGLVVRSDFFPAKYYVTTLVDGDFYRGVTRINSLPVWMKTPGFALKELFFYAFWTANNRRFFDWQDSASNEAKRAVVCAAAEKLKETVTAIEDRKFHSLVFISPSVEEMSNEAARDSIVSDCLQSERINPIYLKDEIFNAVQPHTDMRHLFHDHVHLSKEGHELWGNIIGSHLKQSL